MLPELTFASTAAEGASPTASAGHRSAILAALGRCLSTGNAQVVLESALRHAGTSEGALERHGLDRALLLELQRGLGFFCRAQERVAACLAELTALMAPPNGHSETPTEVVISIEDENGVVDARSRARALCAQVGFGSTEQVKVATAVSELARNIQRYVGRGTVTLSVLNDGRPGIGVVARDRGPGIPNIDTVLSGRYVSKTGLGLGLKGCQRLMDEFEIETAPGRGTTVSIRKYR